MADFDYGLANALINNGDGTYTVRTNATLSTGDIEIGAVEVKNATTDDRMVVDSSGAASVNMTKMGSAAVAMNTGVRSAGTQRVTIATDDVVPASQSGTWTVQPGNTPNTSPWLVQSYPSSASGAAPSNATSTAYEASRVAKASAGNLYAITGYNSKSTAQFVQVHNASSLPSDTAVPVITFSVPGTSNFSWTCTGNIPRSFSTGITVCNSSTGPTKTIGSADVWFDIQYS